MADKKISALTASATPLAGTEVLPIVQSGSTVKVAVSNLTAGRSVGMQQANIAAAAGGGFANPAFIADDGTGAARIIFLGAPYAGVPANKPWLHSYQDIYVGSDAGTTFNVISGGTKTLGVDGSGNATVTGNFVPATAGKGIDFSASPHLAGMTSELLNDYEEGTFIPTLSGATTTTYTTQTGRYTRIGRQIFFHCELNINSLGNGSTTIVLLGDLPTAATSPFSTISVGFFTGIASTVSSLMGYIGAAGANSVQFQSLLVAATATAPNAVFANGARVIFSGQYSV